MKGAQIQEINTQNTIVQNTINLQNTGIPNIANLPNAGLQNTVNLPNTGIVLNPGYTGNVGNVDSGDEIIK